MQRRVRRALKAIEEGDLFGTEAKKKRMEDIRKRWRVPRGTSVDVYKAPRVSCDLVTQIVGEIILFEWESKIVNGSLWVCLILPAPHHLGWVIAQISYPGLIKVQLIPEAETEVTDVGEYMLDEWDYANEKIEDALESCPPDRMKGDQEVKEAFQTAQLQRQKVRDLPGGHFAFIYQTWQKMEKSREQQRVLKEQSLQSSSSFRRVSLEEGDHE
jgi:hypothetical protein